MRKKKLPISPWFTDISVVILVIMPEPIKWLLAPYWAPRKSPMPLAKIDLSRQHLANHGSVFLCVALLCAVFPAIDCVSARAERQL